MYEEPSIIYINEKPGYESLSYIEGPVIIIGNPNRSLIDGAPMRHPSIIKAANNIHDNHEIVKALIEKGANVNVVGRKGSTALHVAAVGHRTKIIEVLLEHGADVHSTNSRGSTALHSASFSLQCQCGSSKYKNDLVAMQTLLRKKPDINARNNKGNTPLMVAVRGLHLDIVKELLNVGADAKTKNEFGETCLHLLFTRFGRIDIMRELINAGAPLQVVDKSGRTPLRVLIRFGLFGEEIMNRVKVLIKTALLVKGENKENYYVNGKIKTFVDKCYEEVQEMRAIHTSGKITLSDFALFGGGKSDSNIDSVYEVMINNTFHIYDDYIASNFEKEYLSAKVAEKGIYTTKEQYHVLLPEDLIIDICKFLSKIDILNLRRAFINCLPTHLNS